jgi:hypothetical protein
MEPKLRIVSSTRGHLPVVQVIRLKTGAFQNGADRPFRIQLQLRSSKNRGDSGRAATPRRFVSLRAKSLSESANVFISLSMRRHLYTNKSLILINPRLVHRAPEKMFTTNVGERKLRASGMGLAHRDDGQRKNARKKDGDPGRRTGWGLRFDLRLLCALRAANLR